MLRAELCFLERREAPYWAKPLFSQMLPFRAFVALNSLKV